MSKIYYLIADYPTINNFSIICFFKSLLKFDFSYIKSFYMTYTNPVGGIKVTYQHCLALIKLGYDVELVRMGQYEGNFFNYDLQTTYYKKIISKIKDEDVIVTTEFSPYDAFIFGCVRKVIFVQNTPCIDHKRLPIDREKSYIDMGFEKILTCSDYLSDYLSNTMSINSYSVPNAIDLNVFLPDETKRQKNRILAMSRKNPQDLKKIEKLLYKDDFDLVVVSGLSESELVEEYQKADIFIPLGYPEGFSLPPLEAMACGCVVVGFTGGGANEFMIHEKTALVSIDGDCESVVSNLYRLKFDLKLKESIRISGFKKANEYGLVNLHKNLDNFYGNEMELKIKSV
jgi:hypothetical protein